MNALKIDIAILEDSEQDFSYLSSLLIDWSNHTDNSITITRFEDTKIIQDFTMNNYDLLFADIELKGAGNETGISICESLRADGFNNEILFLTAFKEYVFDGYNVRALNYLVKPITTEKLSACMKRFLEFHTKKYYQLQDRSILIQLKFNDIMYITKDGNNTLIHTKNETYYERTTLSKIMDKLTHAFIQCHKSSIVNLSHVNALSGYEIVLTDGTRVPVGRNYLTKVRNALLDYSKFD
jgi:DNA-binding LytR/AlgR family response regulator